AVRNRRRFAQVVETHMLRAPRGNDDLIWPDRIAIAVVNGDLDVGVAIGRVQDAGGLMTGELRLLPMTPRRNVPLVDRPTRVPDRLGFGHASGESTTRTLRRNQIGEDKSVAL